MKAVIILNLLHLFMAGGFDDNLSGYIRNDKSIIAPGAGAEGVLLSQSADEVISIKGYPDKVSVSEGKKLFRDIFNVASPREIEFDKIFYYSITRAIIFIKDGKVCAIAGMDLQRVTADSVGLGKGAEYFIFSYGNRNLEVLKKEDKDDIIYFYNTGIAVIDDGADDKIDMYMVFPPGGN